MKQNHTLDITLTLRIFLSKSVCGYQLFLDHYYYISTTYQDIVLLDIGHYDLMLSGIVTG